MRPFWSVHFLASTTLPLVLLLLGYQLSVVQVVDGIPTATEHQHRFLPSLAAHQPIANALDELLVGVEQERKVTLLTGSDIQYNSIVFVLAHFAP